MKRIHRIAEMKAAGRALRRAGRTVGFVPTMGALHEGHLSLVRASRRAADATVVSIFVNPLQFGPAEDYARYPRDTERDAELLRREGVDVLFLPEAREMYPDGFQTIVDAPGLAEGLCGASRPGHFRGVATVVLKLFNIVGPDLAFFGQKDAQQAIILERMVSDLDLDVKIRVMPIVREADGLAMSSRNAYLSADDRRAATVLSRSLAEAARMFESGERRAAALRERIAQMIETEPRARIEYVEIVRRRDLKPVEMIEGGALAAVAVFLGTTRLIDNVVLEKKGKRHETHHA